ncbi:MAG: hypothetical protein R2764_09320 [Bacteroidales bacterium]
MNKRLKDIVRTKYNQIALQSKEQTNPHVAEVQVVVIIWTILS